MKNQRIEEIKKQVTNYVIENSFCRVDEIFKYITSEEFDEWDYLFENVNHLTLRNGTSYLVEQNLIAIKDFLYSIDIGDVYYLADEIVKLKSGKHIQLKDLKGVKICE